MKTIKTISFIMIAACLMQTKAEYKVLIKVPDANIMKMVNIVPHTPLIGAWIDKGSPNNCSEWNPLPSSVKKGENFEQSSICKQEQVRKIEEQVKDLNTGLISKTGKITEESQITNISKKQTAVGSKTSVKKCVYGSSYGAGFWVEQITDSVIFIWYGPAGGSETVNLTIPNKPTSYTIDGYTYSRGDFVFSNNVNGSYYQICRE